MQFAGMSARATLFRIDPFCIRDPSQAARGYAGDAVCDAVAVDEFPTAILEQADERAVDIAEAEEAEVESADGTSHRG